MLRISLKVWITLPGMLFSGNLFSQSTPVGLPVAEDYLRRQQLIKLEDSSISFNLRPIRTPNLAGITDSGQFIHTQIQGNSKQPSLALLPIILKQQINSGFAYGWSDGIMVPAKGYQAYLAAGMNFNYGILNIQLFPEARYAVNPYYFDPASEQAANQYETSPINSGADIPLYYPGEKYQLSWGQSRISLNLDPVSFGISNENLWWGPGRRNALIMSNNASGFKHLTLSTSRPVKTPIGFIEAQIIAGRLEHSKSPLNSNRPEEWRYLSGMMVSYQPKWVPGLSIGLTRTFQMYKSDLQRLGDYIPLFQAFEKKRTTEDSVRRDQLSSIFARWLIPGANAEIYFEYGRNDHSFDLRDFVQQPQHSRAFLLGFNKVVPLEASGRENLSIMMEITHMPQSLSRILRDAGTWYTHSQLSHGFTHKGEVLGAGIGSGASLQTLEVNWTKGVRKFGIQLERLEHNRDYYYEVIDGTGQLKGQWVDLSIGALVDWNYKNLLISSKIIGVQSINYLWQSGLNGTANKDPFNLHVNVGLAYYFKSKEQGAKSKD